MASYTLLWLLNLVSLNSQKQFFNTSSGNHCGAGRRPFTDLLAAWIVIKHQCDGNSEEPQQSFSGPEWATLKPNTPTES